MPDSDALTVHVEADLSAFREDVAEATRIARGFGAALSGAFEGAIVKGRSLSEVLKDLALRLARIALDAALRPLSAGISAAVGAAVGGVLPFARGGLLTPFARGGVLGGPALFTMPRGGLGIAGEAGPEAVLPLARGPDGRLGVASRGEAAPVSVTVNIQTPDVEGFRRARGQIAADLSRTIERGLRNR
jgi:phage-related minor tail protein